MYMYIIHIVVFHLSLDTVSAHYNMESTPGPGGADHADSTAGSTVRLTDEAAKKLRPLRKKDRVPCDGVSDRLGVNIKDSKPALLSRQDTNTKKHDRLRFPTGGMFNLQNVRT